MNLGDKLPIKALENLTFFEDNELFNEIRKKPSKPNTPTVNNNYIQPVQPVVQPVAVVQNKQTCYWIIIYSFIFCVRWKSSWYFELDLVFITKHTNVITKIDTPRIVDKIIIIKVVLSWPLSSSFGLSISIKLYFCVPIPWAS